MNLDSRWLIVTGASSGLGRETAIVLARDYRANLVLVARREERLREVAQALGDRFGTQADVIVADLAVTSEVERVFREATEAHSVYGAVLNAGITHFGHWDEVPWETIERTIMLNVVGQTRLASLLLPYLEQRGEEGGLMIVSSMAGLVTTVYQTVYSATKAYLIHFGCGLYHEMRPRGVSVTTYAPGGISSEMNSSARFDALRSWLMPADQCAREGVRAMVERRYFHVPGALYKIGSVVTRLLPQRFVVGTVARRYRRSLDLPR
jgi:short-subunit dehydrogenase